MNFQLLKQVLQTLIDTIQGTAKQVVQRLEDHTYSAKIVNQVTKMEVKGTVTVGNQKNVEVRVREVGKAVKNVERAVREESRQERTVKVSNLNKELLITNLGGLEKATASGNSLLDKLLKAVQGLHLPTEIKVSNQIDPAPELKKVAGAIGDVEKAVKNLKLDPQIKVEAPKPMVLPPAAVNVEKTEIDYSKLAKAVAGEMPEGIDYGKLSSTLAKEIASMVVTGGSSGGGKYAFQDTSGERGYGLMNIRHQLSVVQEDRWGLNNVLKSGATTYTGEEDVDGNWIVTKVVKGTTTTDMTYATKKNNPTVTVYADAWADPTTLTYNYYSVAFALE